MKFVQSKILFQFTVEDAL